MGIARQLRNTKDQVEKMLRLSPSTRVNDKLLWMAVVTDNHGLYQELGPVAYKKLMAFLKKENVPGMDSVGRVRRKFQQQGLYLPTENTRPRQIKNVQHFLKEF